MAKAAETQNTDEAAQGGATGSIPAVPTGGTPAASVGSEAEGQGTDVDEEKREDAIVNDKTDPKDLDGGGPDASVQPPSRSEAMEQPSLQDLLKHSEETDQRLRDAGQPTVQGKVPMEKVYHTASPDAENVEMNTATDRPETENNTRAAEALDAQREAGTRAGWTAGR